MSSLSLYLHVPFCRRKCNYCDFYSSPATTGEVSSYAKALTNQIRNSPAAGETVSTVYFGGGTPSLLSERDFITVVSALKETFDLSACEEFTVECNPESVSPHLAETWRVQGVNRVSMGVQTFSDAHLKTLGRLHSKNRALEAFKELRSAGFSNISLDLMAALPEQTEEELNRDLRQMISLSPEHLSVYLLKIEPGSAFGLQGISEVHEELQRSMYLLVHNTLAAAGYEHYEISNFAKPGFRARHNSAYWQGREYLAFGPGASGYYQGVRYHIPANTAEYCAQKGLLAPVIDERIDGEESLRESLFLGLRLVDGIDRALIPSEKDSFVEMLCQHGYAKLTDNRFSLTAEGFLVSDYVIRELMPFK